MSGIDGSNSGVGFKRTIDNIIKVSFDIIGNILSDLIPSTTATYSLGNASLRWLNGFFSGNVTAGTFNDHATAGGTGELVDISSTQTLSGKTLGNTTIAGNLTPDNNAVSRRLGSATAGYQQTYTYQLYAPNGFNLEVRSSPGNNIYYQPTTFLQLEGLLYVRNNNTGGLSASNYPINHFIIRDASNVNHGYIGAFTDTSHRLVIQGRRDTTNIPLVLQPNGSNVIVGSYNAAAAASTTTQTINGNLGIMNTTNQLVFGNPSATTTTISVTAPAASRVITLPDAGSDAEIGLSTTQTYSDTITGVYTSSPTVDVHLTKIGRVVTIFVENLTGTATAVGIMTFDTTFDTAWRPIATVEWPVSVQSNGTTQTGLMRLTSAGVLTFAATIAGGDFDGSGTAGLTTAASQSYQV